MAGNMVKRSRMILISLLLAAVVVTALAYWQSHCAPQGIAFTREMQTFVRLKNRTSLPQKEDFDDKVTLAALLQSGDDRERWSDSRAAAIEGYVVGVEKGAVEACNCYSLWRRDTHINVALHPGARPREYLVVEITPPMRDWAASQGMDWSEPALRRELVGHWCHIEGWLMFDKQHMDESENTDAGGVRNWRGTAWEIHPVTQFKVRE